MRTLFNFCAAIIITLSAFSEKKKSKIKLPEEYVLIPGGSLPVNTTVLGNYNKDSIKNSLLTSFYMSKFEVSNKLYRQFYYEISGCVTEDVLTKIRCDSNGWAQAVQYCEPLVKNYFNHPAYYNYPVVNISYEGALHYCSWLQQKIQKENPDYIIEVKLPEKQQWIYAAQGGRSQAMYPWGNYYLQNNRGEFLCNFTHLGDLAITRNRQTGNPEIHIPPDGITNRKYLTAEVKSYFPNNFKLYNMCGNVAEMISEKGIALGGSWNDYGGDVYIRSETKFARFAPTVGFRPVIEVKEKTKL